MADSDIEIQKYYERIRSIEANLNFVKRQVAAISTIGTVTKSNSLDSNRFNAHVGDGLIHFRKETIELKDLLDTLLADPPADKEFLTYQLSANNWINRTAREAIGELNHFNGIFLEKFDALVTSNGAVITMTLTENNDANDLTMAFSDGLTALDVSGGGATITLEAGTDNTPKANYVYILQSGKVLVKSIAGWPATEHIKVGYFAVPSAGFVQTNNVYANQNMNDGTDSVILEGQLTDMAHRIRSMGGQYFSGIDAVVANNSDYLDIAAGNVEFKSQAGVVLQMHSHTFGAFDTSGGDLVLVKNWNGDAYHDITDLFDIVDDSAGVSLANKWFTIVVWGISNKSGELDYIVINLPSGSYVTQAKALEDTSGYTDFSIPRQFSLDSSTGFLIAAIVVKQAATWLYGSTKDLRGITVAFAVAGGTGTGITDHGSLTGLADDDHTQYILEDGTRAFSGNIDLSDNDILDIGNIGSATDEMSGDFYIADDKSIKLGSDQDAEIYVDGASGRLYIAHGANTWFFTSNLFYSNHILAKSSNVYDLGSTASEWRNIYLTSGIHFTQTQVGSLQHDGTDFIFTNTAGALRLNALNVLMDGAGGDDERLRLPYLTGVPASVDNGSIWMEADGLHIYYNGAEKLVAGV